MTEEYLKGKSVLIADDEEFIRKHIAKGLRGRGMTVYEAGTGEDVLDQIKLRPHAVIMDVQMPGLNGLDVALRFKGNPETATIPLILLSARAQDSDIEQGFAAGADRYLAKPVTFGQILETLGDILNG